MSHQIRRPPCEGWFDRGPILRDLPGGIKWRAGRHGRRKEKIPWGDPQAIVNLVEPIALVRGSVTCWPTGSIGWQQSLGQTLPCTLKVRKFPCMSRGGKRH